MKSGSRLTSFPLFALLFALIPPAAAIYESDHLSRGSGYFPYTIHHLTLVQALKDSEALSRRPGTKA